MKRALGPALILVGLAGFLLYVNQFSERGRAGGDAVLAASWLAVLAGIAAVAAGLVLRRR